MKTFSRIGTVATSMWLNKGTPPDAYTVPIVGIPRGGTSMVAAVVHSLGVPLGPQAELDAWHFEDQTMHQANLEVQVACVGRRNAAHQRWGWKDPVGISAVKVLLFALRAPRVIIVCRDWLATIQGELRFDAANGIPERSLAELARQNLEWTKALVDFASQTCLPTLIVSYELAMREPDKFIGELCQFLGVVLTAELLATAKSQIGPSGGYIVEEVVAVEPEVVA